MPAQGSDLLVIQRGGNLYKVTAAELAALAGGGGAAVITEVEVNFAQIAVSRSFAVSVPGATTGQRVMACASANMPAGYSPDELEMDPLTVAGYVSAADTVTLYVASAHGGPIGGKRNINLMIG